MINVIPRPKKVTERDGKCVPGYVTCDPRFSSAAQAFDVYREELGIGTGDAGITASYADNIEPGGYVLSCTSGGISLIASDLQGANNGFSTLLQLLFAGGGEVQAVDIEDAPDCEYRGLMIDAARIWHPFEYLLKYVDLCRYYKLVADWCKC